MPRQHRAWAVAAGLALTLALPLIAQDKPRYAGPVEKGYLLPNGWTVTPAGEQVAINDFPLNILALEDGKHALVSTNGFNDHELNLVDLESKTVIAKAGVRQSWFGLAHDPKSGQIWWAGGGARTIHGFKLDGGKLTQTTASETTNAAKEQAPQKQATAKVKTQAKRATGPASFAGGLTLDAARNVLYSLDVDAGTLTASNLDGKDKEPGDRSGRPTLRRRGRSQRLSCVCLELGWA
jgi:sugar lactone lactonase YvrE